ncbi:recombination protein NinB [Sphingomonas sp. 1P08PE]|uniref:recombination protein NinB n=1 Tax=Sphingomonas sp. 1P08PE TaxID=554122 RepID=UPI0039A1B175
MANFPIVKLLGDTQRAYAHRIIDQAPLGYTVKVGAETRRDAQNRKLWPMLADLQKQVPAMAAFSADDIKLRFLNALGAEMRFLPTLEGQGMFPIGLRSSTLTVEQFSALVELIYEFGARHDVRWSEPHHERTAA